MLRIAVQSKGRLNEDTMNLLEEVGVKLSIGKRQLLTRSSNFPAEILFLRDDDIPKSVAEGIADVGIVGENEYVEKRANADIVKRLGFSNCRLSLAIPKEAKYKGLEWFNGKKIATSYPDILATFLKKNSIKAKIFIITGSVEISPELGVADAIFDIVSSGSTLVAHHLKEVEVIMESEAVMIANKQLTPLKQTIFDELLFRIEAVQEAYNKKYILMNVPNEKIKAIIDILPGMKAPTIMPLVRD
ncbi:MAG: ATP phosphoribosyltransferase, partial [Sphingobacteriia bacterium]|nr:ATP phosphoribosyltransferase [Sphingobacteriia bacterium]